LETFLKVISGVVADSLRIKIIRKTLFVFLRGVLRNRKLGNY